MPLGRTNGKPSLLLSGEGIFLYIPSYFSIFRVIGIVVERQSLSTAATGQKE